MSVILPTFDRPQYLRPAIESVYAQTFADWELIIADDGSSAETRSGLRGLTASDPRVRILWLPHAGNPARARNAAIEAASGRYLAFLDSDDVWAPSKLEKQLAALRRHPGRRWSYTASDRIDQEGRPLGAAPAGGPPPPLPEGWIIAPLLRLELNVAMPTVMAERGLALEAGGFDEEQRFGEYHDLCARLALRSEVVAVAEPLCSVRAHGAHYSGDRIAAYRSWVRLHGKWAELAPTPALRAHCRRQRARASLVLAGLQVDRGDRGALWASLGEASRFSWPYPRWWLGAGKTAARALVPRSWLAAYRRLRAPAPPA